MLIDYEKMDFDEIDELYIDDSEDKEFSEWAMDDACLNPRCKWEEIGVMIEEDWGLFEEGRGVI